MRKKGVITRGIGRLPSALLAGGLGTPFGPEGAENVITGALDIPAIEVSCSIIQVGVKRGSARDRRKIKPFKSPRFEHLSMEDEEILIVISEFLFLEAA